MATPPRAHHVSEATDVVLGTLGPEAGRDWNVPAGDLEWTCRETAVHIAHDLAKYAAQLARAAPDPPTALALTGCECQGRQLSLALARSEC